nr:hypothetical protein [Tanacetum cinerariifolium]
MSSDNAQSPVTYTSISSNSDGPSWGIPFMYASELPEMDPYEEVAQQGHVPPLSPAYVPEPIKLDEHVPVYDPEPEHPEYHAPSDDDIHEDEDEDPEEDPSEEHNPEDDDEDPEEDPNEGHEPKDEDTKDPSKGSDETELFEEDETAVTPPPPRNSESSTADIDRAPRSQYDFVNTVEAGHGLIRSLSHDAWTIARAADRAEDVGYEVHQAYFSSEAQNRALLARLETLETQMSRMEIMPATRQGTSNNMTPEAVQAMSDQAIQRNSTNGDGSHSSEGEPTRPVQPFVTCTMLDAALTWWNGHVKTLGHDDSYAMTWEAFKKKLTDKYCPNKIDKYIGGLLDNIHGNVMSARPKTLDFAIELANDLMDRKLRTYAERQNENKRKVDDSSRNNQQQPHKKKNIARAYTPGPGEKKVYTGCNTPKI